MKGGIGDKIKFAAIFVFLGLVLASEIINLVYFDRINNSYWLTLLTDPSTALMVPILIYLFGISYGAIEQIIADIVNSKHNKVKPQSKKDHDDKTEKPKSH